MWDRTPAARPTSNLILNRGVRPSWYTTTGLLVDCCNATVPIETLVLAQDAAFEIAHEE